MLRNFIIAITLLMTANSFAEEPTVFGKTGGIESTVGDARFGETIPISAPGAVWRNVDYKWEGQGLPIEVARVFKPGRVINMEFGSFELDYPKLVYPAGPVGMNLNYDSNQGFTVEGCKTPMPDEYYYKKEDTFGTTIEYANLNSDDFFHPVSLHYNGQVIQFHKKSEGTLDYPGEADLISKSHWYIVCGITQPEDITKVAQPNITVVSPEGVRHHFDSFARNQGFVYKATATGGQLIFYPDESKDFYGNSLSYTYGGGTHYKRLANISANDGRSVDFNYESKGDQTVITSVDINGLNDELYTINYNYEQALASTEHNNYCSWYPDAGYDQKSECISRDVQDYPNQYLTNVTNVEETLWEYEWEGPEMSFVFFGNASSDFDAWAISTPTKITNSNKLSAKYTYGKVSKNIYDAGEVLHEAIFEVAVTNKIVTSLSGHKETTVYGHSNVSGKGVLSVDVKINDQVMKESEYHFYRDEDYRIQSISKIIENQGLEDSFYKSFTYFEYSPPISPQFPDEDKPYIYKSAYTDKVKDNSGIIQHDVNQYGLTTARYRYNGLSTDIIERTHYEDPFQAQADALSDCVDNAHSSARSATYGQCTMGMTSSCGGYEYVKPTYHGQFLEFDDPIKTTVERCDLIWFDSCDDFYAQYPDLPGALIYNSTYEDFLEYRYCGTLAEPKYKLGLIDKTELEVDGEILTKVDNTYNSKKNLSSENADGVVTGYTYDTKGNLYTKTTSTPDGDVVTKYSSYYLGSPKYVYVDNQATETRGYDGFGNLNYFNAYDGIEYDKYYDDVQRPDWVDYLYSDLEDITYDYDVDDNGIRKITTTQGTLVTENVSDGMFTSNKRTADSKSLHENTLTFKSGKVIKASLPSTTDLGYGFGEDYDHTIYDGLNREVTQTQVRGDESRSIQIKYDSAVAEDYVGYAVIGYDNKVTYYKQNTLFDFFDRNLAVETKTNGLFKLHTILSYDEFNRLNYIERKKENGSNLSSRSSSFSIDISDIIDDLTDQIGDISDQVGDALSDLNSYTSFNLTYHPTYTAQVDSIIGQDGYNVEYAYGAGGLLEEETRNGLLHRDYTYNDVGLVSDIYGNTGESIYLDYYRTGDLKSKSYGSIGYEYTYTDFGEVDTITLTTNDMVLEYDQDFDSEGTLEMVTYPSGNTYDVTNDSLHQGLKALENIISDVTYTPLGAVDTLTLANDVSTKYTYDDWNRVESKKVYNTEGDLVHYELGYLADDNIETVTDHLNASKSAIFGYDHAKRLSSVTQNSQVKTYAYNECDVMETKNGIESTNTCTRRDTDFSANEFGYGDSNEVLTVGSRTFDYGQFSNLLSYDEYEYVYDGDSYPAEVTMPTLKFTYLRTPDGKIVAAYEGNTETHKDIVRFNGEVIAERITTDIDEDYNGTADYLERIEPDGSFGPNIAAILVPIISLILN